MTKQAIENSPAKAFISREYRTAVMYISTDTGSSDKKIMALDSLLRDRVNSLSFPPGVKVMVTGTPQIIVTLFDLLGQDALNTILYASVIILFLLFVIQRSLSRGFLIFAPLAFGLIWTYGTLGWMGVKISIATAGLGAIILGLGVEYGVFMLTRYREERTNGVGQLEALKVSVPAIGAAITGSATTTIVGFLALTFSSMPMIQNLGFSLALGIFFALLATLFLMPVIIIVEESASEKFGLFRQRRHEALPEKRGRRK